MYIEKLLTATAVDCHRCNNIIHFTFDKLMIYTGEIPDQK